MVSQDEHGQLPSWVTGVLRCPVTGAPLERGTAEDGTAHLVSTAPGRPLAYPLRDGVPVLLPQEAHRVG